MRRGVFNMVVFLMMASTLTALFSMHRQLVERSLQSQAQILDALELFYAARNAEWMLAASAASPESLHQWYLHQGGPITYGYFSSLTSSCVQVEEDFDDFVAQAFRFQPPQTFMEAYGTSRSCIVLPMEKGGFKTSAVFISPKCVDIWSSQLYC